MAYFAQLDENNIVTRVLAISDKDCEDPSGQEVEQIGIDYCQSLFSADTIWKQTSFSGRIRKQFAAPGFAYRADLDAFIEPQPYPSWVLNLTTANWESPIGSAPDLTPEEKERKCQYSWNETNIEWVIVCPTN